jgi:glycerol-3-phosphate acyltransferase PlsY
MPDWVLITAATVIGYLLGSLSPAWILGRVLRGVDIRTINYRNAGTRNVKKSLGLWPAVLTAIIDTTKGIGALLIARHLLGVSGYGLVGPAVAAVAGHIFPFYLGWRGGRGTATAIGLYLYLVGAGIAAGTFAYPVLAGLLVAAGLIYAVSRSGDATALFVFLAMAIAAVVELGLSPPGVIALICSGYTFVHAVFRGRELGLYRLPEKREMLGWRVIARPLALLFLPIAVFAPQAWFRGLLIVLAGAALALDAFRMVTRRRMARVYKAGESRQLSSITLFLVSTLLLFVLFPLTTAALALGYLSIGDLAGKLMGLRFGRHELLAGRTLEGSVGFVVGGVVAGYAIASAFGAPGPAVVVGGAVAAAIIELLSMGLDDNLTVGLGSAGIVTLLLLI